MQSLYYVIILISIFLSCTSKHSEKNHLEEKIWLTQFFKDLLLYHAGIYTLCGTKPITIIPIPHYTKEEIERYYATLGEEEKKKLFSLKGYSLPETWDKWKQIQGRYPMKRFFLIEWPLESNEKITSVYFVNILQTAAVITENYDAFRRVIQFDFDPLEIVLEMDQRQGFSEFWQKISKDSYLWGILLGYGKANSYAFDRKYSMNSTASKKFLEDYPTVFSRKLPQGEVEYSIENFEIPMFVSFSFPDVVIEKYQVERKRIQELYKGKDFLDFTLQILTEPVNQANLIR